MLVSEAKACAAFSSGEIGSLIRVNSCVFAVYFVLFQSNLAAVDLSLIFVGAVIIEVLALKLIPHGKRVTRFVVMSLFFTVDTLLIVALIGTPLSPVFRPQDLPREFWLQILACVWWGKTSCMFCAVRSERKMGPALPASRRRYEGEPLASYRGCGVLNLGKGHVAVLVGRMIGALP